MIMDRDFFLVFQMLFKYFVTPTGSDRTLIWKSTGMLEERLIILPYLSWAKTNLCLQCQNNRRI